MGDGGTVAPGWELLHPGVMWVGDSEVGDFRLRAGRECGTAPEGTELVSSKDVALSTGGLFRLAQVSSPDGGGLEVALEFDPRSGRWGVCRDLGTWHAVVRVGRSRFSPDVRDQVVRYISPEGGMWERYREFLDPGGNQVVRAILDVHDGLDAVARWRRQWRLHMESELSMAEASLAQLTEQVAWFRRELDEAAERNGDGDGQARR